MAYISNSSPSDHQNLERNRLARIRRQARKRGFRILKDWSGAAYDLVCTSIHPPCALVELNHVPLGVIEAALSWPLPPPRLPRKRVARPTEPQPTAQACHPAAAPGFHQAFVDLLKGRAS
jgi:hypothetical protein